MRFGKSRRSVYPHLSKLVFLLIMSAGSLTGGPPDNSPLTVTTASSLKLTVSQGGGAARQSLLIKNTGTTKAHWSASSNQAWLKFEPASGSVSPKASASIKLVADPTGFAPGIYVAS